MFETGIYKQRRTYVDRMSHSAFMLAITGFSAAFIIVSMLGALISYDWTFANNGYLYLLFMLACMGVAICGAELAHSVDDPIISVVGGSICAFAMGLFIGPFVALFELGSVVQALAVTAGIVVITGFIGALLPQDLSSWGAPLFGFLIGAVFLQFGGILLAAFGLDMQMAFSLLDWAVLLLFCGIMVYDLNMSRQLDRTMNNAIDVAVKIHLTCANILIRLLGIGGNAND